MPAGSTLEKIHERSIEITVETKIQVQLQYLMNFTLVNARDRYEALKRLADEFSQ
jgi:hypothetical protein